MIVNQFASNFSGQELDGKKIIRLGKKYFYTELKAPKKGLVSTGIFLGEESSGFIPSLALLEILAKGTNKKVFISEKAEWLFLCGRDVFEDSVTCKHDIKQGELVLVQNQEDENLGYGRVEISGKRIIIRNLLDRGDFLRRER